MREIRSGILHQKFQEIHAPFIDQLFHIHYECWSIIDNFDNSIFHLESEKTKLFTISTDLST